MKSAAAALTWEYWKGGWHYVLGAMTIGVGMLGLIFGIMFRMAGPSASPEFVADMFHPVFFATLFLTIALASMAAGLPELRFTLPVTSWSIVTWPLLNGLAAVVGVNLFVVLAANGFFHAGWPIVKPALAAGSLFAICHGLNWTIQCGREGRHALAVLFALAGGVLMASLCHRRGDEVALDQWKQFSSVETLVVVGLVLFAYFAATVGVASARRGRPLSATELANFCCEKLDLHFAPARAFPSAHAAQRWLEWSEKGLALPIGATVAVGILFLLIAWSGIRSTEILQVMFSLAFLQVVAAVPLGFYLGTAGPHYSIREFTAVRPLSDTQLADAILWNTARSVCWSWVIWWGGVLCCLLYAAWIGAAPRSPMEVFPKLRSESWTPVAFYIAVSMAGSLLASWTVISLSASWILVRQWMFLAILLIVSGIPIAISICTILDVAPEYWGWMQGGAIGLLIAFNLSLYVMAYCRRLIGWRRLCTLGILVVVLFAIAALFVPQLPVEQPKWALAWLVAISPLPFLAFAAAPLALGWTRHR